MSIPLSSFTADPRNIHALCVELAKVMDGTASILPLPPATTTAEELANTQLSTTMRVGEPIAEGTLIACTSGSTGTPKGAMLSARNLRSSAESTVAFLNEEFGPSTVPGAWLLTVPPHHIAGLQVVLRSLSAGHEPLVARHLTSDDSFTADGFITDTEALRTIHPTACLYTSLVPTQLERLTDARSIAALQEYAAILVGGAATRTDLLDSLRSSGARLVTTYGSSETAGGCVYDGRPLPNVRLFSDANSPLQPGRIKISGPMVAQGYRNVDSSEAFPDPGTFVTSDLGTLESGTLKIVGRADGAINSGGYKILPEDVERLVQQRISTIQFNNSLGETLDTPFNGSVCAVGIPHPEFGNTVAVALEVPSLRLPADITANVREQLCSPDKAQSPIPRYLVPTFALALPELPLTGPGKLDRRAIADLLIKHSPAPLQ